MNLILGQNDFKYDSGASEKHFIFLKSYIYFWFLDPFLDTADDAKW